MKSTKIYIVNVITDYRYRPKEISFMNLMEFQCNVKKMEFGKSDTKNKNIDSNILNTIIQNCDIEDDQEDEIQDISKDIDNNNDDNIPRVYKKHKTGRKAKTKFMLQKNHPQFETHYLCLTEPSIPLLTGNYIPKLPKRKKSNQSNYQKKLNDFGSYFITLLCPWNFDTGVTEY